MHIEERRKLFQKKDKEFKLAGDLKKIEFLEKENEKKEKETKKRKKEKQSYQELVAILLLYFVLKI